MERTDRITAVFEPCEEGGYHAFIPEMPGVHTQGETLVETIANLSEAVDIDSTRVDRKSTRLNSSHTVISYAVFCLKKKKNIRSIQGRLLCNAFISLPMIQ